MYAICVTNTMRLKISAPNENYCKCAAEVTIQTTGYFHSNNWLFPCVFPNTTFLYVLIITIITRTLKYRREYFYLTSRRINFPSREPRFHSKTQPKAIRLVTRIRRRTCGWVGGYIGGKGQKQNSNHVMSFSLFLFLHVLYSHK